jgi:mRNA interferase YafQ
MREIVRSTRFKRDYKREKKGQCASVFRAELEAVLRLLVAGNPLPERYHDHQLTGNWNGCRDCHIKPDVVLLYRIKPGRLELVRIGSHSELGL